MDLVENLIHIYDVANNTVEKGEDPYEESDVEEVRWTIRVYRINTECFHWVVTRSTEDSRYQKDGDEPTHTLATASAIDEISIFERLGDIKVMNNVSL